MKKRRYSFTDFAIDIALGIFTCGWWWGYKLLELLYKLIFNPEKNKEK